MKNESKQIQIERATAAGYDLSPPVKVGRDTTIKSFQVDILQQIASKYHTTSQQHRKKGKEVLVPTKATLFGLDVRFRDVDRKIAEGKDLDKRLALNQKQDSRNRKFFNQNRHTLAKQDLCQVKGTRMPRNHLLKSKQSQEIEQISTNLDEQSFFFSVKEARTSPMKNRNNNLNVNKSLHLSSFQQFEKSKIGASIYQDSLDLSTQITNKFKSPGQAVNPGIGSLNLASHNNSFMDSVAGADDSVDLYAGAFTLQHTSIDRDRVRQDPRNPVLHNQSINVSILEEPVNATALTNQTSPRLQEQLNKQKKEHQPRYKWHDIQHKMDEKDFREGNKPIDYGYGQCFDDLVDYSQHARVPRNVSFFKPETVKVEKNKTKDDESRKRQKLLARSQVDQLISKTKHELDYVNNLIKSKNDEVKLKQRQEMYALKQPKSDEGIDFQLQVIKRANIFADEEYAENMRKMMIAAKQAKIEQELEEQYEKDHLEAYQKHMEEQKRNEIKHRQSVLPSAEKKEDDEVVVEDDEEKSEEENSEEKESKEEDQLSVTSKKKGNASLLSLSRSGMGLSQSINNKVASQITDSFLFGDDIKIPIKSLDTRIGGLKPSSEKLPELKAAKKAGPKPAVSVSNTANFHHQTLYLQPKAKRGLSNSQDNQRLSIKEKELLSILKHQEIEKYKSHVKKVYSSETNWSQLISAENNDMRNQIMQNVKLEQIKRRKLREFLRVQKEKIIQMRQSNSEEKRENQENYKNKKVEFSKKNDDYNKEYKQYFESKVTKAQGGQTTQNQDSTSALNSKYYPKRHNDAGVHTVEEIAANVQQLVNFCMRKSEQFGNVTRMDQVRPNYLRNK